MTAIWRASAIVHRRRVTAGPQRRSARRCGQSDPRGRGQARGRPGHSRSRSDSICTTACGSKLIRNGTAAILAFPTGELWLFEAGGWPVAIEESIYFASPEGPRRIEQLVVRGEAEDAAGIAWSLRRTEPAR